MQTMNRWRLNKSTDRGEQKGNKAQVGGDLNCAVCNHHTCLTATFYLPHYRRFSDSQTWALKEDLKRSFYAHKSFFHRLPLFSMKPRGNKSFARTPAILGMFEVPNWKVTHFI